MVFKIHWDSLQKHGSESLEIRGPNFGVQKSGHFARIVFWRTKMSFPTVFDDSNYWADLFFRSIHVSIQNFEVLDEEIHKMRPLSFAVPLTPLSPVSRKHGVTMKKCPVKINSSARFLFWVTFIWHCVYHFPKDFNVSSFFTSSFLHLFSNLFQLFSTHT